MAGSLETKRLSMNTVLKNARIFDDDSWDAETGGFETCTTENKDCSTVVKSEPKEEGEVDKSIDENATSTSSIRVKSVEELTGNAANEEERHFKNIQPKQERVTSEHTVEELDDTSPNIKEELGEHLTNAEKKTEAILNTPIKKEIYQDESNPSPFNKELFRNFSLESPQSKEHVEVKDERKKAVKRVFENIKEEETSDVSSELEEDDDEELECPPPLRISGDMKSGVKKRLGDIHDHNLPKKRQKKEMETDPATLSRRQKQIDYGKNTLGYDNYIKQVPKSERSANDPKTPNKNVKYSRRAWDGLIKQWRLQLHKYDPVDV